MFATRRGADAVVGPARFVDSQLAGDPMKQRRRRCRVDSEFLARIPQPTELHGEPQAVRIAAAHTYERQIGLFERVVTDQLFLRLGDCKQGFTFGG